MQQIFRRWIRVNSIVFGLLLIAGGGLFFYLYSDIVSRVGTVVQARSLFATRSQGVASLASLRDESRRSVGYLDELNKVLPHRDDLFGFSRAVESAANNRKLNRNFSFGTESAGASGAPSSIAFTLTTSGGYENTVNFLRDIENADFLVTFSGFDITQSAADRYDTRMSGQVFFRP